MTKLCETCGCSFSSRSRWARWCVEHRPSRSEYLKAWGAANAERKKANDKAYYESNRDSKSQKSSIYYQNNREAILLRVKAHYSENCESIKGNVKEWRGQNKEKVKQYNQKYLNTNPETANAGWHLRRARILGSANLELFERNEIFARDNWICKLCNQPLDRTEVKPHPMSPSIDHIIPLSRGGEHNKENCQAAHLGCNRSKGPKIQFQILQKFQS